MQDVGIKLIALLRNKASDALSKKNKRPFLELTHFMDNEKTSWYKLERAVLGLFCSGESDKFPPPYHYDIINSQDIEEDVDDDRNDD